MSAATLQAPTLGQQIWNNADYCGREVFHAVRSSYNWAGKKVEVLLSKTPLSEKATQVVMNAIWSLPYTVAFLAPSGWIPEIAAGLSIGIWGICPREIDEGIGIDNRRYIYMGIRNAYIIRTTLEISVLLATGNWLVMLVPIIRHGFFAAQSETIIRQDTPEKKFWPEEEAPNNEGVAVEVK